MEIFANIGQHSPLPDVIAAVSAAKALNADMLVSLGGGSVIDATKVVQYCLAHDITDEALLEESRGVSRRQAITKNPPVPHVSIPTTLSGAEFTCFAGARNPTTGLKQALVDPQLTPRTVIFDSALTQHTPQVLWLSSGIRALDHAVEGLCSHTCHPFGEILAKKGIGQLASSLARNKTAPDDVEGRRESQFAAWYASVPLISGVTMGASHAIGHAIGSIFNIPHGLTSCVTLPAVMQFNMDCIPKRLESVARALGGQHGQDAPELVRRMVAGLGLPITLSEVGLGKDTFTRIAEGAMTQGWIATNPRRIRSAEDVIRILELAA